VGRVDAASASAPHEQFRAEVALRLRAREREIVEAIFEHARRSLPESVVEIDFEHVAELHAAVTAAVGFAIAGVEHGEQRCGSTPLPVLVHARREARAGVGVEAVLVGCVACHTLLEDFVLDAAEATCPGEPALARGLRATQAALLGRLTRAISEAHREELERAKGSVRQHRAELARRLLRGEPVDTAALNYTFDSWHVGVIAIGAGAEKALHGLATELGRGLLVVPAGEHKAWAWLASHNRGAAQALAQLLAARERPHLSLALGEPAAGVEGFRFSHRQAQSALQVALRQPQWLTRYADVALLAFALRDEALARSLIELYIAPLDEMQIGGLVARATLRAYFACGHNTNATASCLKVNRRTVWYRLDKIRDQLGWAPHDRRAEFEVALRLEELMDTQYAHAPGPRRRDPALTHHRELQHAGSQ
jgi:hypothetical protein